MTDPADTPKCGTCGAEASAGLPVANCPSAKDLEEIRAHLTTAREIDGRVVVDVGVVAMQQAIRTIGARAEKLLDELGSWFLSAPISPPFYVQARIDKLRAAIASRRED